jgi:hypothetical protein
MQANDIGLISSILSGRSSTFIDLGTNSLLRGFYLSLLGSIPFSRINFTMYLAFSVGFFSKLGIM